MLQRLNELVKDLKERPRAYCSKDNHDSVLALAEILKEYIERNVFVPLCTLPEMKNEVTFKLTEGVQKEVDRILKITDLKDVGDIFQKGLNLLRVHIDAKRKGDLIKYIKPNYPEDSYDVTITLPFNTFDSKD